MLFSQKKLAKLKQSEQRTEPDIYGRNAAIMEVFTPNNIQISQMPCQSWGHTLFLQPQYTQCEVDRCPLTRTNQTVGDLCSLHSSYSSGSLWMSPADQNTAGSPPAAPSHPWACSGQTCASDPFLKTFTTSQKNTCRTEAA